MATQPHSVTSWCPHSVHHAVTPHCVFMPCMYAIPHTVPSWCTSCSAAPDPELRALVRRARPAHFCRCHAAAHLCGPPRPQGEGQRCVPLCACVLERAGVRPHVCVPAFQGGADRAWASAWAILGPGFHEQVGQEVRLVVLISEALVTA